MTPLRDSIAEAVQCEPHGKFADIKRVRRLLLEHQPSPLQTADLIVTLIRNSVNDRIRSDQKEAA